MKRRTGIVIAAAALGAAIGTSVIVAGCQSSGDGQVYQHGTFTAAVPCQFQGQHAMCATVNGIPVIVTGAGYRPLTPAQIRQVEDSAPTAPAGSQEPGGGRQAPVEEVPGPEEPADPVQEHVNPEPDPVEVHPVIVDK